jgi:hypothetical protein
MKRDETEVLRSTSFERIFLGELCKVLLCMTEGCTLDAEILSSGLVIGNTV